MTFNNYLVYWEWLQPLGTGGTTAARWRHRLPPTVIAGRLSALKTSLKSTGHWFQHWIWFVWGFSLHVFILTLISWQAWEINHELHAKNVLHVSQVDMKIWLFLLYFYFSFFTLETRKINYNAKEKLSSKRLTRFKSFTWQKKRKKSIWIWYPWLWMCKDDLFLDFNCLIILAALRRLLCITLISLLAKPALIHLGLSRILLTLSSSLPLTRTKTSTEDCKEYLFHQGMINWYKWLKQREIRKWIWKEASQEKLCLFQSSF